MILDTVLVDEQDNDLELERRSREFMREIQKLRKQANVAWDQQVRLQYISTKETEEMLAKYRDEIIKKTLVGEIVQGDEMKIIG